MLRWLFVLSRSDNQQIWKQWTEVVQNDQRKRPWFVGTYHHHHHIISYHIVDLKRQNRLRVGTDKPKLKVKMQSVSDDGWCPKKTSWKATFWADGERCIQIGKMLQLPAGHSRSLGQQLGKIGYRQLIAWPMAPEDVFLVSDAFNL